jgi:hypothetical protein
MGLPVYFKRRHGFNVQTVDVAVDAHQSAAGDVCHYEWIVRSPSATTAKRVSRQRRLEFVASDVVFRQVVDRFVGPDADSDRHPLISMISPTDSACKMRPGSPPP